MSNSYSLPISWHLYQVLLALDYSHLPMSKGDSLHESFASQLERLGMWHWAAFVLLHLSSGPQRHAAVSALLQRHLDVCEDLTERENFLVDQLHIPRAWLHQAKVSSPPPTMELTCRLEQPLFLSLTPSLSLSLSFSLFQPATSKSGIMVGHMDLCFRLIKSLFSSFFCYLHLT